MTGQKHCTSEFTNPAVAHKFASYPDFARPVMLSLRQLILDTASETEGVGRVEETLKWGEPGYLVQGGSTIRIDWKNKDPGQYAMYFNCQSKLIDTFKELYADTFRFHGNRAILFGLDEKTPTAELKHCVKLSLTYHRVKHLPLLGA